MFGKIEHIGIAVKNLEDSNKLFTDILGVAPYKQELVASEHVLTSFFKAGENKIELLQATSPESSIARFLDKNKEGMHHIAFAVNDIYAEIKRLKDLGYTMIHNCVFASQKQWRSIDRTLSGQTLKLLYLARELIIRT